MVGTARWLDTGQLRVRQFTLGRISDEARFWRAVLDELGAGTRIVTFNGKSFDLPLVEARCTLNRQSLPERSPAHLDLLYPVRRLFRATWPDCRLQTAERRLLGLARHDDLPGELAPLAWGRWLRHGDARELAGVLLHNHQDVVSLALLHHRLVEIYRDSPGNLADPADIGRAWLKAGRVERAVAIWEAAGAALAGRGRLMLADAYKRRGDWVQAVDIWQQLHAAGCPDASSELAKYFEHRRRDYHRAVDYAASCQPLERDVRLARLNRRLGC
jgi:tetratricopeptide (TPR) repeat protein